VSRFLIETGPKMKTGISVRWARRGEIMVFLQKIQDTG
jgi:hypothetical protein